MTREVSSSETGHLDVARQLTELQIQTAQKICQQELGAQFDEKLFGTVLIALATNYNTTRMFSKAAFKS